MSVGLRLTISNDSQDYLDDGGALGLSLGGLLRGGVCSGVQRRQPLPQVRLVRPQAVTQLAQRRG